MEILTYPDKKLKIPSTSVTDFEEIKQYYEPMQKLVVEHSGYALAAPQIGIHKRFFIISNQTSDEEKLKKYPKIVINPVIKEPKGPTIKFKESCLSIPGIYAWNYRIKYFNLEYNDEKGELKEIFVDDLFAIIVQHEMDHLEGKLFIDSLSSFEMNKIIKQLNKFRK